VLSVKTGQLSFLVSALSGKAACCWLEPFHRQSESLLVVEQALLSLEAKPVQPANLCFQCSHLQVDKVLPESVAI